MNFPVDFLQIERYCLFEHTPIRNETLWVTNAHITLWSEILWMESLKKGQSFANLFAPQRSAHSVICSTKLCLAAPCSALLRHAPLCSISLRFTPITPLTPLLASLAPLTHSLTHGNIWFPIGSFGCLAPSDRSDHSASEKPRRLLSSC